MARYEHDCDQCKPLGVLDEFDLYFCQQLGVPTVIARFGPDGEYLSGLGAATDGPLKEAKTRAIVAGYLTPDARGNAPDTARAEGPEAR
jgi:hypothetical protein